MVRVYSRFDWSLSDRVLYEPKTMVKIAEEAVKEVPVFSLNDRMGVVYDTVSLSKAGLAQVSSALTLIDVVGKKEKECWFAPDFVRKMMLRWF